MAPNNDELLGILQVHGQRFLDSFVLPELATSRKRKRNKEAGSGKKTTKVMPEDSEDDYEEWGGITDITWEESPAIDYSESNDDFEQKGHGFTADSSTGQRNVVVFSDITPRSVSPNQGRKAQMKAFMSSKVSKIQEDLSGVSERKRSDIDEDDELTNVQNDALLHRLVHTKLLSGSLNQELEMTPAHRRKALAGRIMELAGGAKLGKGEQKVREAERNKAAKRVREGIIDKQKGREKQRLEEAKNHGNYHPTIKKLFESSGPSSNKNKKRDRGLKMGVGKFNGGFLKLSQEEISLAVGGGNGGGRGQSGFHSRGRGRGRGRGRIK